MAFEIGPVEVHLAAVEMHDGAEFAHPGLENTPWVDG